MSVDPSYISPDTVFDEQPPIKEAVEKPLKPGKLYGMISVLCGLEPMLATAFVFLINLLIQFGMEGPGSYNPVTWIVLGLIFGSPICVIAGIVFGIWGRKTEGRCYAIIGLVLSLLSALLVFGMMAFIMYHLLVPCC